jgi:two-component system chemotaxis response regulator CheB
MKKQRVMVVDDSAFIRRMITDWINGTSDLELVGVAKNGEEAENMARDLKPDVVTLDVEMPVKSGLEALPEILKTGAKVLMVSSVTKQGATSTLQALEAGAYDFVTKPSSSSSLAFTGSKDETLDKIRASRYARHRAVPSSGSAIKVSAPTQPVDRLVVIASSTGGPSTLRTLWEQFPKNFPAPILIVQHMPEGFTASLAKRLDMAGTVPCREAKEGDKVVTGQALLCPGGVHMIVKPDMTIAFTDEPKLHGVKPAADYLFHSAAQVKGNKTVGVVLTGMGRDGAEGAVAIRKVGGRVLGENEESCVIYGMPKAAKDAGGIDAEFPLEEVAGAIMASLNRKVRDAA